MLLALLLQAVTAAAVNPPLLPKLGVELLLIIGANISFIWGMITWKIKRSEDAAALARKDKEEAESHVEEQPAAVAAA